MWRPATALRATLLALALGVGGALPYAGEVRAADEINLVNGYAVHGYDVVAYFTDSRPTPGDDRFTASHEGATYRFASAASRDAFLADPDRYAPQYGGYCAFGTAMGIKVDGRPDLWAVIDDRLFLNVDPNVQRRFLGNPEGYIRGADHNWPLIANVAAAELQSNPPAGVTQGPR
jgi:YHS domain-containing protein